MTSFCSATAAGQRKATVPLTSYHSYIKHVTIQHGLELVGWPFPTVVSFPAIPYDFESLDVLLSALQNNECRFQRVAPEKLVEIRRTYYEPLLSQTLRSAVEKESAMSIEEPPFTRPHRRGKDFHLITTDHESSSGTKRCNTV